ncbi:MAG: Flp pilus assembly complex ATPase component [Deltaproteobacteria bacterium]|nr:Flp pilus assembly complex ATPase component [Deltaproteobacteria bacterium]
MFKVTVSEKGGPERELFFEDEEVSIGRLQGNSVVLPKPNVSKRHATLIIKDGKATIVDQKSTNGTYVNGRRISSAKELGKDDRVYIGDFTIRCLPGDADEGSAPPDAIELDDLSPEDQHKATMAMPAMPPADELSNQTPLPVDLDVEIVTDEVAGNDPAVLSGGALDQDSPVIVPEIPSELLDEAVEAVEAIEAGAATEEPPIPKVDLSDFDEEYSGNLEDVIEESAPGTSAEAESEGTEEAVENADVASQAEASAGLSQRLKKVVRPEEGIESSRHMEALRIVAAQAAEDIFAKIPAGKSDFPDDEWDKLSDRVLRLVDRLRREEVIPSDVDPYAISQDLLFEFTGLGPLEELLGDETIRRITVEGPNRVFLVRNNRREASPKAFVNQETLDRVLVKLTALAGITVGKGESLLEGRLPDGTFMMILKPPLVVGNSILVIERPRSSTLSTDDLVAAEVMSEGIRAAIERAVKTHANLVVCGPPNSGKSVFLNAVLKLISEEDRVVVVERRRELTLAQRDVVNINKDLILAADGPGPCIATRLLPDVVVVSEIEADDARLLTSLGLSGQKGLIMSTVASSAQACVQRMELMLSFAHPTMDPKAIQSLIQKTAEFIVVLGSDDDGRSKVVEAFEMDKKGKLKPIES